jgi:hypothetical protein
LYKEEKDEEKKKPKPPLTKHAFYISPEELSKPVAFQLLQPSSTQKEEESAPELPSRLPVLGSGRFSLGLRLGFPEPEGEKLVGAPGTGMKEALRKGKLMNQIITGKVPTSWEALDKGKLAKAIWGIFSTKIAPDLARDITSNLSKSMGQPGVSYELDLVILTDFKGGGLSFTVRY